MPYRNNAVRDDIPHCGARVLTLRGVPLPLGVLCGGPINLWLSGCSTCGFRESKQSTDLVLTVLTLSALASVCATPTHWTAFAR